MEKLSKEDGQSMDIVDSNITQLKEIFPEVFAEGKIDFDKLQALLGNYVNTDEDHYNFTWHGKRRAARLAQTPSTGTLRPCKAESVDWDTTQNLFIEGDNLEVLKLLQKSYHRQVKMIYIDPPYNTGNDFVYEDDFKDGVKHYLEMTGQLDSDGKKLSTNSSSAGRYHTNWLNMMYPRLKLARNLLRDDGVIFISIDDNEQDNLKKLCNEVFGEENFVGNFIWKNRTTPNDAKSNFASDHEYIYIYAKNYQNLFFKGLAKDLSNYKNPDNDPNGEWIPDNPSAASGNYKFEIINPYTGEIYKPPTGRYWAFSEKRVDEWQASGKLVFPTTPNKNFLLKKYLKELKSENKPIGSVIEGILTSHGTKEINKLYPEGSPFKYPKPPELIKLFIEQTCNNGDLILDFFAGSATTAHSLILGASELKLRFILVQLPEPISKDEVAYSLGYRKISAISIDRILRVSKKIKEENPLFAGDLGFKVFKLDTSNIKPWDAGFETLENDLIGAVDYIKQDRTNEDVLYELLLKYGLDLTVPIETRIIGGKNVYIIGMGALIVCLDKDVSMETVEGIGKLKEELNPEIMRVVFKDNGFKDDVVKTNAIQTLKRFGIEDIKSL